MLFIARGCRIAVHSSGVANLFPSAGSVQRFSSGTTEIFVCVFFLKTALLGSLDDEDQEGSRGEVWGDGESFC